MRTTMTLLAGLMLATALLSFAPAADAARCIPGDVAEVCIPERCDFQSDCCDRGLGTGFWCPEDD